MFLIVIALAGWMVGCGCGVGPTTEIRTWFDLDTVREGLGGNYILMNDLDSGTPGYEELAGPNAKAGAGWEPIGSFTMGNVPFTGNFDGQGYEIRDLFINRPHYSSDVGLFGGMAFTGPVVKNVGVVNCTVVGAKRVGGIVGLLRLGTLSNCYCTGDITGTIWVGGLAGVCYEGTVTNSYATGSVTGTNYTGGLVGSNGDSEGTVRNSYFEGSVTGSGDQCVGGLVGINSGTVTNCYSSGNVAGPRFVGGLVGASVYEDGVVTVSDSYSTCTVSGDGPVGGLMGMNGANATVSSSYSTGSATGESWVGGLAGANEGIVSNCYSTASARGSSSRVGGLIGSHQEGHIDRCYSTGHVAGEGSLLGGLVGWTDDSESVVSNSFWDVETSGRFSSDGGIGKTTAEMKDIVTFTDVETEGLDRPWDMCAVASGMIDRTFTWNIVDEQTYPFLCTEREIEHDQTEPADLAGVQTGAWIKIGYQISGWPPDEPHPEWLRLEFLQVEGTSATVQVTMHMSDGTEQSDTVPTDLSEGGGEAFGLSGFVISPQLTTGDSVHISGYGDVTIEGETARTYAGTSRTVVYASFSEYGVQLTYYWDKETGVMVEASSTSGDLTATAIVTETNMW
jgi:hypothetical protein